MVRLILLGALLSLHGCAAPGPVQAVRLRWVSPADGTTRVEATGLSAHERPEAQLRVFAVAQGEGSDPGSPSMAGTYRCEGGLTVFEPQFPPDPGVTYRAVARSGDVRVSADYTGPAARAAPPTVVEQIYPTADLLPENLLKFYVHFSAPMRRGQIYDHIRLLDDSDKPVELPFLEIGEELWDPTMTRLTLFIDPGRIKRGVQPLEEVGPALVAGRHYRLVIDAAWKDAAGNALAGPFEKRFDVGPPDRDPPDPAKWIISAPTAGSGNSLSIGFPEPMDHALALRLIVVTDSRGNRVSGHASLDEHERHWRFIPEGPWRAGRYCIVVPATIEDLAGNNVGKPFDVDLADTERTKPVAPVLRLPFDVP